MRMRDDSCLVIFLLHVKSMSEINTEDSRNERETENLLKHLNPAIPEASSPRYWGLGFFLDLLTNQFFFV